VHINIARIGEDDTGGEVFPLFLNLAVLLAADLDIAGGARLGDELIHDDVAEVREIQPRAPEL
jgi:hypothetical protein